MLKILNYLSLSILIGLFAISCTQEGSQNQMGQQNMDQQQDTASTNYSKAVAVIHPTEGNNVSGTVTFEKVEDSVTVSAEVEGLEEGQHGFHVHQYGDCSASDGTSAGGHYNPTNNDHGAPTDENRHMGDMGNIEATGQETATRDYMDPVLKLNGPDGIIGHAVIIHGGQDDFQSQPSGDAGPRLACGVIGIAEADTAAQN